MKPAFVRALGYSVVVLALAFAGRPLVALLAVAASLIFEAALLLHGTRGSGRTRVGLAFLLVPLTFPFVPTPKYSGEVTRREGETSLQLIRRAQMREALDRCNR